MKLFVKSWLLFLGCLCFLSVGAKASCEYKVVKNDGVDGTGTNGVCFAPIPTGGLSYSPYCFRSLAGTEDELEGLCNTDPNCVAFAINPTDGKSILHYDTSLPASCPSGFSGYNSAGRGCPTTVNSEMLYTCKMKVCTGQGDCGGDPHMKTWSGKPFNYQGECDLVMASSKSFQDGKGLDLHVRTKTESVYSIVAAVAVMVGMMVLEFNHEKVGFPKFLVNGSEITSLPFDNGQFKITSQYKINEDHNKLVEIFDVDLGDQASLQISVMDQWVYMSVNAENIMDSKGLMGSFPNGNMLARDGVTDLSQDRKAYGAEWQVQAEEPQLFHSTPEGHPQAPHEGCKLPAIDAHFYLRTRNAELYQMAVGACMAEGLYGLDLEDCIFDVSVMNNPKIAAGWWAMESASSKQKEE